LTNLFFLITPSEYEKAFKEEIWGCYKYMNIPLDIIYSMPIMDRKYFIKKHNEDVVAQKNMHENEKEGSSSTIDNGMLLNEYAKREQTKRKNQQ
jgi:hypothetical protein